ncbi:tripartite tricarboxylate transporter substrate binding protein [Brevibacillus invocatus]|uniref:Tripartite tricarboxylate transporter substrate binding protein n=1 Tax=Brevibacillus invocatus TaxID=173959 RepID=A0A3M8CKQ1_9BACL|nr:tripartite tricarboxylate transporter substrate binding protein [Brevibacillus invocatus]MCM3078294.1 tripartite tricarboxylate transporter substrate binding protein [Brevibacillus invocatus]MCM3428551.1 tripartite tricarboxylate transporter substrate binding protein [Brevibacillus invocatus]RNB76189.1 tripartite tricarboxylate transporter substrate binding protein [Brevibacillus invocatus]
MLRKTAISVIAFSMLMLAGCGSQPASNASNSSAPQGNASAPQESTTNFPTGTVTGVIQWGAGGALDTMSRKIGPLAEKHLGNSLVLTNKPGATGAIAVQYVNDKKSDGHNLLFAAENPALYGVMKISDVDFKDFYPVNILARGIATVVVPGDSKYQTLDDLIKDAQANPGKVKMASTGPGGLPFTVTTMLGTVTNTQYNMVPFDGDGPSLTALLGGHLDATVLGLPAAIENAKAGKVRVLSVINDERIDELKDVPAVVETLPDMKKYLPWGPFYGVWVKKDTPDDVKKYLVDVFAKAQQDPDFQDFLSNSGAISVGISGDEAVKYWMDWQSTTAWLLQDAGAAKVSPADLNIEKKN